MNKKINAILKTIARKADINLQLTTYYARHTWATLATELGFPRDLVGRCLGHTQKSITEVYIKRDFTEIDEANRKVIDFVLQLAPSFSKKLSDKAK